MSTHHNLLLKTRKVNDPEADYENLGPAVVSVLTSRGVRDGLTEPNKPAHTNIIIIIYKRPVLRPKKGPQVAET